MNTNTTVVTNREASLPQGLRPVFGASEQFGNPRDLVQMELFQEPITKEDDSLECPWGLGSDHDSWITIEKIQKVAIEVMFVNNTAWLRNKPKSTNEICDILSDLKVFGELHSFGSRLGVCIFLLGMGLRETEGTDRVWEFVLPCPFSLSVTERETPEDRQVWLSLINDPSDPFGIKLQAERRESYEQECLQCRKVKDLLELEECC